MDLELKKTFSNEIKLSEEVFQKLFARSVELGERSDQAMSPSDLAGAIPEIWDKMVEIETAEKLYLTPLISSTILNTMIVEKTDLLAGPGDTLWISKIGQLEAPNDGALPESHQIEGQEVSLNVDMVSFKPTRFGVGIAWTKKTGHATAFSLKATARLLLAQWAAGRIERLLMTALNGATRILYAEPADSVETLNTTDTFNSADILRAYVSLLNTSTLPITQLGDYFLLLLHPLVFANLMRDSLFTSTVATASAAGVTFDLKGFLASSYSQCRIAVTPLMPHEASAGSPGVEVYTSALLGARALGLAYEQKPKFLEKISSYGENLGVATDFWAEAKILRNESIVLIKSAATAINV